MLLRVSFETSSNVDGLSEAGWEVRKINAEMRP